MTHICKHQSQKKNLQSCALSKDSDQPAQSRSLIRIFTGYIWDSQWFFFFIRTTKTLIRLHGCAGWFESSLGAHVRRYGFSQFRTYVEISLPWWICLTFSGADSFIYLHISNFNAFNTLQKERISRLILYSVPWSVRVAERLGLPTSEQGVPGSNPTGGEIQSMTKGHFTAHIAFDSHASVVSIWLK